MSYRIFDLDSEDRARHKQASRDEDLARLHSGEVSPAELSYENDFFAELDVASFEIVAIGGRPLHR